MAKKKGICRNEECEMYGQEFVQEADEFNFVCEKCQEPLFELPKKKSWWDLHKKQVMIGAAAVAVIAVIVVLCMTMLSGGDKEKPVKDEETSLVTDTSAVAKPDTSSVDTTTAVKETEKDGDGKDKEPETKPEPPVGPKTVFGGRATYNKAAGVIKFNSTVTISLHDEDDNTITLRPGDEIRGAKISGGRLVGGEAVIGGESQLLTGINERL